MLMSSIFNKEGCGGEWEGHGIFADEFIESQFSTPTIILLNLDLDCPMVKSFTYSIYFISSN